MRHRKIPCYLFSIVLIGTLIGCSGKKKAIPIVSYPSFWTPKLKRVAILPFKNYSRYRGAGRIISDKLDALLTTNKTYQVYSREHLRQVLAEQDLAATDMINSATAVKLGRLASVQAIIVGAVTRYEGSTRSETRYNQVPRFRRNRRGQMVIAGYRSVPYRWTRHEGTCEANAKIISTETGKVLDSFSESQMRYAQGRSPRVSRSMLMTQAAQAVAWRLLANVAVTRQFIQPPKNALALASGYFDGKWDYLKTLKPNQSFYVVVRLTNKCDRNRFKVAIARAGDDVRSNLWEKQFAWRAGQGTWQIKLAASKLISAAAGEGEFILKLYSGPSPVLTKKFKIKQ